MWPAPLAPRELPRASAFAGVHLVRLWDTGVIRNVGSAAAVVGCSSARGDHESSASPLPCECQRHRQERKCVALCITCLAVRSKYPSGPASRSTPAPKPFDGISLCENHVRRAGLMTATSGFSCWETSVAVSPFPEGKIGKIALESSSPKLGVRPKIDFLRTDPTREVIHIELSGAVGVV